MRYHTVLIALAAAVFSTVSVAQSASAPADDGKTGQASKKQSAAAKANYSTDDCHKDLSNAKDAKQAGHITDKEIAEQKKMSQTKLKRDSGKSGQAAKNEDCG